MNNDENYIEENVEVTGDGSTAEAEILGLVKPAKKDTRARAWMLTISASKHEQDEIVEKLSRYTAFVGQLEEGQKKKDEDGQGFLHWQIYVENDNPIRFSALKTLFPTAHIAMRKTTAARCVAYCTKQDSRVGPQIKHGEIDTETTQGQRNDLSEGAARILNGERYEDLVLAGELKAIQNLGNLKEVQSIYDAEVWGSVQRADLEAHFISGKSGIGKTSTIYAKHGDKNSVVHSVDDYRRSGHCWDSYKIQPVLLMDEFEGNWSLQWMRKILDRYRLQLPARYSNKFAAWDTVYVLSNESYSWQWKDADDSPTAHQAVRRRFTSIGEMQADGSMIYERYNWEDLDEPLHLSYEEAFGIEKPKWIAEQSEATKVESAQAEDENEDADLVLFG